MSYHPMYGAEYVACKNGFYTLNDEFYKISDGIFGASEYYDKI